MHGSGASRGQAVRRAANLAGALSVATADRLRVESDAAALVTLLERRTLTIEWLRRIVGLSHSATVRLVDRLAADGLVARQAGPDGRSVAVALTIRGRRTAARLRREREQVLIDLLAPLGDSERRAFVKLAEKLLAGLTSGRWEARFICRHCDHGVCAGGSGCPVDAAATALGE